METAVTKLFGTRYPIVQAGMVWCSGHKLAAAASQAGALGLVGCGSMRPAVFREHLSKLTHLASPWGVNLPIFYKHADDCAQIILDLGVKIVFTSAGNPRKYTSTFKAHGIKVVHVVATTAQALKCEAAGCDAVVTEGFEAGGHNGPDELTTMVLTRMAVKQLKIPVIAAGGIVDGHGMAAALALGAAGVQVGSRFAVTQESSAHEAYKQAVVKARETDTVLALKAIGPARFLKNGYWEKIREAEARGVSPEELRVLAEPGVTRRGIHEGDLEAGELEVGQAAGLIEDVPTAAEVVERLVAEYRLAKAALP